MGKKTGAAIKEARTSAGLTQEQLARKIKGISATDISKAERGEMDFTQAVLKEIAKATGVTQASLLNLEKSSSSRTSTKKSTSASSGRTEMKLTQAEHELITLFRKADPATKRSVVTMLQKTIDTKDMAASFVTDMLTSLITDKK